MSLKKQLPASILTALGLTSGCNGCDPQEGLRLTTSPCLEIPITDTAGPCLMVMPEPSPTPDQGDIRVGPCLKVVADPVPQPPHDVPIGPCLEIIAEPPDDKPTPERPADPALQENNGDDDEGASWSPPRNQIQQDVLRRGVLPADVVEWLREKQKTV